MQREVRRGEKERTGGRERAEWCKGVEMKRACGWRYDERGAEKARMNERRTRERKRED